MNEYMGHDWQSFRDILVAELLKTMPTSRAFTMANREADEKFGKRQEPTVPLPVDREASDPATRRAREECYAELKKHFANGAFKSQFKMRMWASSHLHSSIRHLTVRSFTLEECEALLSRLEKLERM